MKALKNIPGEIQVYRIQPDEPPGLSSPATSKETPTLPRKPSIAVLPFTNMSSVRDQEFFADGMTEDLITAYRGSRSSLSSRGTPASSTRAAAFALRTSRGNWALDTSSRAVSALPATGLG